MCTDSEGDCHYVDVVYFVSFPNVDVDLFCLLIVRESRNEPSRGGRGGGRGYGGGFGRGRGGGGGGFGRDFSNDDNSSSLPVPPANQGSFEGDSGNPSERRGYGAPRAPYRVGGGGGRRGGFSNGEGGEEGRPRRTFDRHSGTGRG